MIKTFKTLEECQKNYILLRNELEKKISELEKSKTAITNVLEDLYDAHARLREIDLAKSDFISVVSHQLRTPLSTIKWNLEMILAGELGKIPDKQKQSFGYIYESNQKLINVLEEMLRSLDVDEGKIIIRREDIHIEDLIYKVIEKFKLKAKKKNISMEFKKPEKLPKISLDEMKIKFVLGVLIRNAIRYTQEGGKITIDVSKKILDNKKGGFLISVTDTGIGIPKKELHRVFDKFFRGKKAQKFSPGGIGLGLHISKAYIEVHGGKIWVESEEGKGSTFYFVLPLK